MDIKEITRKIYEEGWNQQEFDDILPYISETIRLKSRGNSVELKGDAIIGIISKWKTTFPDLHFELLQLVKEGNTVAVDSVLHGTPQKEWKGYQPKGKSIAVPHAFFMKYENNKLVEVVEINDFTVLKDQLT